MEMQEAKAWILERIPERYREDVGPVLDVAGRHVERFVWPNMRAALASHAMKECQWSAWDCERSAGRARRQDRRETWRGLARYHQRLATFLSQANRLALHDAPESGIDKVIREQANYYGLTIDEHGRYQGLMAVAQVIVEDTGEPDMRDNEVYIFQAALLCASCATKHMAEWAHLKPAHVDDSDLTRHDSNEWPNGPYGDGGGEADSPQHCDHCGVFLNNPITCAGQAYVRELAAQGPIPDEWRDAYDYALEPSS